MNACKTCDYIQFIERNVIRHLENVYEMMGNNEITDYLLIMKLNQSAEKRVKTTKAKRHRCGTISDEEFKKFQRPKKMRKVEISVPMRGIQNNHIVISYGNKIVEREDGVQTNFVRKHKNGYQM